MSYKKQFNSPLCVSLSLYKYWFVSIIYRNTTCYKLSIVLSLNVRIVNQLTRLTKSSNIALNEPYVQSN